MHTPKINWVLFGLYFLVSIGLLFGALIAPPIRSFAPAPVRDWIVPPPKPIELDVLYSTEKAAWIELAAERFMADAKHKVQGHPIQINLKASGSREIYLSVLDGAQPDMISPASMLQISLLQDLSTSKFGAPVVDPSDTARCRPVLKSPLVLVAWRERADVLWGDEPNGSMWLRMHEALANPQGWEAYGRSEWGYIKFSHTNPLKSNSGFQTILLMSYNYFGKTSGLTSQDILADDEFQAWFLSFENTISNFGDSTGTYMQEIISYGPSLYDFVSVYEATAIAQMENAVGKYGELRVYYPPATSMSDHPFCILEGEWVASDKETAALMFLEYLSSEELQQQALLEYGFRPTASIPLDQPGSPFLQYTQNGVRTDIPPEVDVPPGDVLNTLLDFWARNVQP
ncbi:MAG: substrate-binding domain-containing protein, partial [Anaerolineales bacterium]